jgi:molybdenum cofactor cytidylyltransferase
VTPGCWWGTVKIIAYAVEEAALAAACAAARGAIRIARWCAGCLAGLILTEVPGLEAKLAAKGRRAIEGRLRAWGCAGGSAKAFRMTAMRCRCSEAG